MVSIAAEKLNREKWERASEVLKRETLDVHRVVESAGFMKDLLSPSLVVESYVKLLGKLLAVVTPIEDALVRSPFVELFPSVVERSAVRSLQNDLLSLDQKFEPARYCGDPFPVCSSLGSTAGVLYVIEGSANGGRIFYKFLESRLGLTQGVGLSYFAMQAGNRGLRFMAFKEELDRNLGASDVEVAVDYAKLTFRRFA